MASNLECSNDVAKLSSLSSSTSRQSTLRPSCVASTSRLPRLKRTLLLIENMHCPSCVSGITTIIESQLEQKTATKSNVSVSLLTGIASFEHPSDLDVSVIEDELQQSGYNIVRDDFPTWKAKTNPSISTSSRSWWSHWFSSEMEMQSKHNDTCSACRSEPHLHTMHHLDFNTSWVKSTFTIHGMTCSSCTTAIEKILSPEYNHAIREAHVVLFPPSSVVVHDSNAISVDKIIEMVSDGGFEMELVTSTATTVVSDNKSNSLNIVTEKNEKEIFDVLVSISGMTCAACVAAITNNVNKIPGVLDGISVNLIGANGMFQVHKKAVIDEVVENIENAGFDCEVVKVSTHGSQTSQFQEQQVSRDVTITIAGMFCGECITKVQKSLQDLSLQHPSVYLTYSKFTLENPTISLKYDPNPPDFTLRNIREEITKLGFNMIVVRPPSLEERARRSQARERKQILYRLGISALFTVPVFLIGIVIMMLLPSSHPTRQKFMSPVWGSAPLGTVILFALATPIQFGVGWYFTGKALKSFRSVWRSRKGYNQKLVWFDRLFRWGSMDTLVALGTWTAYISSVVYMALQIATPASDHEAEDSSEEGFFDTCVFLMFFILAGRYLEALTKSKTGDAITELVKIKPAYGILISSEDTNKSTKSHEVDVDYLEVGDYVLVPVGSSPPMDGVIALENSQADFDESSLTGESRPVAKSFNDFVYAGTTNVGPSAVTVCLTTRETMVDGIVDAVRSAMGKKAGIERIAQKVTAYFVPAITTAALITFLIWLARGYTNDLPSDWNDSSRNSWVLFAIQFGIATLVVACPCGIGLAAPTAQMVGVGLAARYGILPRGGGEAFQEISRLDTIVFDKTGTLTKGAFTVTDTLTLVDNNNGTVVEPKNWWYLLLKMIEVAEQVSTHPLSVGLRNYCENEIQKCIKSNEGDLPSVTLTDNEEIPGRGIIASLKVNNSMNVRIVLGNAKHMRESGVKYDSTGLENEGRRVLSKWQTEGKSVILAGVQVIDRDDLNVLPTSFKKSLVMCALFAVQDPPREEASEVIEKFRQQGVTAWMISGDNVNTARAVAALVGIDKEHVIADASPTEKCDHVSLLQKRKPDMIQGQRLGWWNRILRGRRDSNAQIRSVVGFVGDGINDAAALAQADVGMAMGSGSSVALSTADFALLNSSLTSILCLRALASATLWKIYQNFAYACMYNIVLIPLAAGAFYSFGHTRLPPAWAALSMALSSVTVVLSSLLLKTFRPPKST